jgi:4'-phosphopantetheinyl transferase
VNGPVELAAGEIHVWLAPVREWTSRPDEFDRLLAALSPEERDRRSRFVFERDREVYGLAHGMLRRVLARLGPLPPEAWRFDSGPMGRPELAPGQTPSPLRFNLSHTPGLAACALALESDVGIDVENLERAGVDVDLTSRSFSESEQAHVSAASAEERRRRFFQIWTLKEAYIKATGRGLSVELDSFSVSVGPDSPRIAGVEGDWFLAQILDWPPYIISVAARGAPGAQLFVHRFVPGGSAAGSVGG